MKGGMDNLLATHFAHLFIRDPLVIFCEDLQTLDLSKTDHFENLQSTNWQHMRFKPPPPDNNIGWRVEFRPMEVQITDFENAAFAIFIVLVTRAILSFNLNFYIPITKVAENMEAAHSRNAVLEQKFYFRKDPFPVRYHRHSNHPNHHDGTSSSSETSSPTPQLSRPPTPTGPVEDEYELMSIDKIINGDSASEKGGFLGLIPMVESYLGSMNVDILTRRKLTRYLDLIRDRASGKLWTGAKWIRDFVDKHENYGHDSVVSEEICYDLLKKVEEMTEGNDEAGWEILGTGRRSL